MYGLTAQTSPQSNIRSDFTIDMKPMNAELERFNRIDNHLFILDCKKRHPFFQTRIMSSHGEPTFLVRSSELLCSTYSLSIIDIDQFNGRLTVNLFWFLRLTRLSWIPRFF